MIAKLKPRKNEKALLIKKVDTLSQEQIMKTIEQLVTETTFKVRNFCLIIIIIVIKLILTQ